MDLKIIFNQYGKFSVLLSINQVMSLKTKIEISPKIEAMKVK